MKKQILFLQAILLTTVLNAQNVGIGTPSPLMKLHVVHSDSAVALLENTQTLNTNVSTAMYFKTGSGSFPYTGAIKTIGESNAEARLGFFSFAASSPNGLKERLSITDAGIIKVGIGGQIEASTGGIKFSNAKVIDKGTTLKYFIHVVGVFPTDAGSNDGELIGEIKLMARPLSNTLGGWLPCEGQILPIASYTALFSLLGPTYGGNGTTTFALPDLRKAVPVMD
jgi:hypothetical protein